MKKMLLIAFLLITVKGFAQISLEYTFTALTNLVQVSDTEWDYYNLTNNNSTINIYALNHSLITSFQVIIPSSFIPTKGYVNLNINPISYLSKGLFTSDNSQYAFMISFIVVDTANSSFSNNGAYDIQTQSGSIVLQSDSSFGGDVVNSSGGTKFLVENEYTSYTQVYDLPGTYNAGIPRTQADIMVNNAYPNPTDNMIHLPYNLNGNAQGELDVVNMSGQLVKQFKIGSAFNDILLNTGDLPKGSYLYYITTNGQQSHAKQFVVQ